MENKTLLKKITELLNEREIEHIVDEDGDIEVYDEIDIDTQIAINQIVSEDCRFTEESEFGSNVNKAWFTTDDEDIVYMTRPYYTYILVSNLEKEKMENTKELTEEEKKDIEENLKKSIEAIISLLKEDCFDGELETPVDSAFLFRTDYNRAFYANNITDINALDVSEAYTDMVDEIVEDFKYETEKIENRIDVIALIEEALNKEKEAYKKWIEKETEQIKTEYKVETVVDLIDYTAKEEGINGIGLEKYYYWTVPHISGKPLGFIFTNEIHHCDSFCSVHNMSLRNAYRFLRQEFNI